MTKEQADLASHLANRCQMLMSELCQKLGVSTTTYYLWMEGKRRMKPTNEAKVRQMLDEILWKQAEEEV